MWVGYPGEQGGHAVARSLFGSSGSGPAGRLTMTWHSAAFVNESNYTSMAMRAGPVGVDGKLTPGLPGRTYRCEYSVWVQCMRAVYAYSV
jgi:beta-D-xylosidase 4